MTAATEPVAAAGAALRIDVVSDVVCPWCYLGKRRLARALDAGIGADVEVGWRPFRLDPTIPPDGIPREQYLTRKFGSLDAVAPMHQRLAALGAEEGIDFRFEGIGRAPDTVDAHRLIAWAGARGMADAMVERLFAAYFTEGRDIGERRVLVRLAAEAGLDDPDIGDRLAGEEDRDTVVGEIDRARRIGVTGVPCFILDGRYAVMGAQPPETLAAAIGQALAERSTAVRS